MEQEGLERSQGERSGQYRTCQITLTLGKTSSQEPAWWPTTTVLALGRLRKEDHEFRASLGYKVRLHLKISKLIN